jgi:hypothetical protein
MFSFFHRAGMRSPSGPILRALESDSLSSLMNVSALGVVESRGRYSGRRVTYFRVFDPSRAGARAPEVLKKLSYKAFDSLPDLVLRAGRVEEDGTVVFDQRRDTSDGASQGPAADRDIPIRASANRADHPDDERFVSHNEGP